MAFFCRFAGFTIYFRALLQSISLLRLTPSLFYMYGLSSSLLYALLRAFCRIKSYSTSLWYPCRLYDRVKIVKQGELSHTH